MKYKRIYIEITNVCNLNCSFCPESKRINEFMSITSFEKILKSIKGLSEYLYFHVKGEPLLHPNIDEFLGLSHINGFKVNITTNGHNIDKIKDKIIGEKALRQISFSLQSIETINGEDKRKIYLKNILDFAKEASKEGKIIELRLWNLNNNSNRINDIIYNKAIFNIIENELDLDYKLIEKIDKTKGERIRDKIYLSQSSVFIWPDINNKTINTDGFCYGLRNQFGILVDGTVIPCCLDGEGVINLGNIFKEEIVEILSSKRAVNIVDGFSNRKAVELLCQKCGYRTRFD